MQWYSKQLNVDGEDVLVEGTFDDSIIRIVATYKDKTVVCLDKPVQMWSHQEILAEDIYRKYQGKIQKFEKKQLPLKIRANKASNLE